MCELSHLSIKSDSFFHFSHIGSFEFDNVLIASTESHASFFKMLFVVSHAEPTEFVSASTASHMHASLILFNWGLTFGAFLRVYSNPEFWVISSSRVFFHLLLEHISEVTFKRWMSIFVTFKTEPITTVTENINYSYTKWRIYDDILTTRKRTIFEHFVGFHKILNKKLVVSFYQNRIVIDFLIHEVLRLNNEWTFIRRTSLKNTLCSILHSVLNELSKTSYAEIMAAFIHLNNIRLFVLSIANFAQNKPIWLEDKILLDHSISLIKSFLYCFRVIPSIFLD